MNGREAIVKALEVGDMVVQSYLGDLSDADLMQRPGEGCNHIAWQLGHLIESGNDMLRDTAPGFEIELPAGFAAKHTKETKDSDNPKAFLPKAVYLEWLGKVNTATKAALAATTDAALDGPSAEKYREWFPTVGVMYLLCATHPLMHAGQWAVVRRKLGKPIVI